ncbi:neutral zinc metallopeptidase [Sphaerisporangium dianthi]|uniref:Neutral zinc metallopeptidase n=1 Tax=Sphaerisporangium dianthi TaxID=1436120 RepID=A0ABV9CE89_9ACTN
MSAAPATLGLLALAVTLGIVLSTVLQAPSPGPAPALTSTPLPAGAVTWGSLERNLVYAADVPVDHCPAPPADDTRSRLVLFNALTDCMGRSWRAALRTAGVHLAEPTRVFWTRPGRGACGDYPGDAAAFYCPANQGIYLGAVDDEHWMVLSAILAHEYGHHVQEVTGIMDAEAEKEYGTTGDAVIAALSRRLELQADCFAGVWFSAVRRSLPVTGKDWGIVLEDAALRGDEEDDEVRLRTHGTGEHVAAWLNGGFRGGRPGHCDTWAAPAADVA